jgi:hypothetical protein
MALRLSLALTLGVAVLGSSPVAAHAAACPPASSAKPVFGVIKVGSIEVPLVRMPYAANGILHPPATNQAAGISDAHAPLDAELGTTVIAWHVRYGAHCPGSLNAVLKLPIGGTFAVTDFRSRSEPQVYEIVQKSVTPRGRYPDAWFSQVGPHRLALFTCTDRVGGAFRKTVAIFAAPVEPQTGTNSPVA